jgi:hypothetical protein
MIMNGLIWYGAGKLGEGNFLAQIAGMQLRAVDPANLRGQDAFPVALVRHGKSFENAEHPEALVNAYFE